MLSIYVDTNIFIAVRESGSVVPALVKLFDRAHAGGAIHLATSEITLAELIVRPAAEARADLVEAYDSWIVDSDWLSVASITRACLWNAGMLRSRYAGLKLPDAIHLSAAASLGCSRFLTFDSGIKGRYEIPRSRYPVPDERAAIEIIRPEQDALESLLASHEDYA